MSEKDQIKEDIGYLKFWIGIHVALIISLGSWLLKNWGNYSDVKFIMGVLSFMFLLFDGYTLHKKIKRKIEKIKRL